MEKRITPQLEKLEKNELYVYGLGLNPNFVGRTAEQAKKLGGREGNSYSILIKDHDNLTLPLYEIDEQVTAFISYAKANPFTKCYVSDFGTGLDGHSVESMAVLFADAVKLRNVYLPEAYWDILITRPINKIFKPIADETYQGADQVVDIEEWAVVTKAIADHLESLMETALPTKIEYSYNGRIEAKVFYE